MFRTSRTARRGRAALTWTENKTGYPGYGG
jgi:hypothetical protein